MVSWVELVSGVPSATQYALDYVQTVKVETKRLSVTTTPVEFDLSPYRVVIVKNPSSVNVYISTYSDKSNAVTVEPGLTVGIGLEMVKLTNKIYIWADANATVELLLIR